MDDVQLGSNAVVTDAKSISETMRERAKLTRKQPRLIVATMVKKTAGTLEGRASGVSVSRKYVDALEAHVKRIIEASRQSMLKKHRVTLIEQDLRSAVESMKTAPLNFL